LSEEETRRVARRSFQNNPRLTSSEIRKSIGRSRQVVDSYIADLRAAIEVHRNLGPGLLESAYEECLCRELVIRGLTFERQKPLPLSYKGIKRIVNRL